MKGQFSRIELTFRNESNFSKYSIKPLHLMNPLIISHISMDAQTVKQLRVLLTNFYLNINK